MEELFEKLQSIDNHLKSLESNGIDDEYLLSNGYSYEDIADMHINNVVASDTEIKEFTEERKRIEEELNAIDPRWEQAYFAYKTSKSEERHR